MAERVLVSIPRETVNDDMVVILDWKVASGARVEEGELICEVETSKAVLEIHAPAAGFVVYECSAGEELPVGATICAIGPEPVGFGTASQTMNVSQEAPQARLSAAARLAAAEYAVDAGKFAPGTLVRREDVLRAAGKPDLPTHDQADSHGVVPVEWAELPRRKLLEGRILHRAREVTIQSSVTSVCRITHLSARLEELGLPAGGIQQAIIFESSRLLHKYPEFNAVYGAGQIGRYRQINIGWALDGGQGLVVPVIRDADKKTIHELASIAERQTEAYLENVLSPDDLAGGTFTVTDLSGNGVSFFQPLLVEGQSAILGIGKGPGPEGEATLYLTLAFDHQVAEGKRAAEFLRELSARLEIHAAVGAAATRTQAIPTPVPYCAICQRDGRTLQDLKVVLLKSEVPAGFVCSLCVAGW